MPMKAKSIATAIPPQSPKWSVTQDELAIRRV